MGSKQGAEGGGKEVRGVGGGDEGRAGLEMLRRRHHASVGRPAKHAGRGERHDDCRTAEAPFRRQGDGAIGDEEVSEACPRSRRR